MAQARLRIPAYGKRLLLERRAGACPLEITLVYGDHWWEGKDPKVCMKPEDYGPGTYDFCMLAGARVTVIDQLNEAAEADGKFYDLLREIAVSPALVVVKFPNDDEAISALEIASGLRKQSPDGKTWPRWWDGELDLRQRRLIYDWLADKRKAPHGRVAA